MSVQMTAVITAGIERMVKSMESSEPISAAVKAHIFTNDHTGLVGWARGGELWPELAPLLPAIKPPCLVFAGERDPQYEGARDGVDLIPNATFVSIPEVGHLGAFLRSDLVLPHVLDFLAKVTDYSPVSH